MATECTKTENVGLITKCFSDSRISSAVILEFSVLFIPLVVSLIESLEIIENVG